MRQSLDHPAQVADRVPRQRVVGSSLNIAVKPFGIAAPTVPPTHVRTLCLKRSVSLLATTSRPGPAAGGALAAELVQQRSIASGCENSQSLKHLSVPRREPHLPEL
jgi:hypothetical protein